ncbi:hypothetical protein [Vibrio anguillarum]|uniref:hypothetical protein n=1 Tax=Vibrio anguillarum TaxID=55601 RepID=UPI000BB4EE6A|nr:hypothetical protein [Vibrio anguillarum]ATC60266.1 hypothetical protein CMV05_23030 [Vibrio anguillarum]
MNYDDFKVIPPAIENMANDVGMTVTRVAELVPQITKDILRTWHTKGLNPENDALVERAWKEIFKYPYTNISDDVAPAYVKGPPGQGKTTAFKVATEQICKAMNVKLYIDPDLNDEPKPTDVVMVIPQLGGALSTTVTQGIPSTQEGMTVYSPPSRIAKMIKQPFSVFLLDDLDNAHDSVKNSAMPIVQSKRLNDINLKSQCYVCVTGNLGAVDGTNTGKDSSALLNRANVRLACDTLGDWLERGSKRFNDDYGMAFIDEFLMQNPENFYPAVERKYRGQRPTSRSWDALTNDVRNHLAEYDAQQEAGLVPSPIMPRLKHSIPSHIGNKVGTELQVFFNDVLTLARPAAMELMNKGELSDIMRQKLQETFSGNLSTDSESVSRGFLRQITNMAANRLNQFASIKPVGEKEQLELSRDMFRVIDRFAKGCFTTGLVKGNKVNLIAQSTHSLLTKLVDHGNSLTEDNRTITWGRMNEAGDYIPSDPLVSFLTKAATKYGNDYPHGEALTDLKNGKNQIAMESAFLDPITYVSQAISLENEVRAKMG